MKEKLCTIRKDIIERKELVRIGSTYYKEVVAPLKYRWLNDDEFQVFFKGKWRSAESIDFDFEIKTSQYQLLLEIQDVARINVVTCAHCSAVILHRLNEKEIQCYDCNEVLDPSACPDIFHEELPITEQKKQQHEILHITISRG